MLFLDFEREVRARRRLRAQRFFVFSCIALLPREVLIIRARLLSASRAPLNPSGLVGLYFAFLLSVLGSFLLPIRPLRVCAASPSFLPFRGHVVEFWG